MTRPKGFSEPGPLVSTVRAVRTSAGVPVTVPVTITNQAAEARVFVVSAAGVDPNWLPFPSQSVPVPAGESIQAEMTLRPAEGTLPARYPLAVAVQALEPATGHVRAASTIHGVDLVVDAPGQISIALDPPDTTAVYSRKFFVVLQNSGQDAETVHLDARSPYSTAVDLSRGPFLVPPGSTVRVPGRLTVSRPTLFRRKIRHAYSVTARTSGAPRFAEGSLTARSIVGPTGAKIVSFLLIIALWVGLALIFVPKLADKLRKPNNQAGSTQTLTVKPPNQGGKKGSGGKNGSGGGNSPNGGGSGTGSGSGGGNGSAGATKATFIALNGTITGSAPAGVLVSLSPSTFGDTTPNAGSGAAAQTVADTPIGKLTPQSLAPDAISSSQAPSSDRSTVTTTDGAWSFPDVKPVGYYVLQFSKPGYQTQRFIIDPTSGTATQPMKVELVPGTGSLHGIVRNGSGGNVGAATITITDGTNTLTTSTISKGAGIGTWSIDGLSTPSSYLVSASKAGLGVASRLVSLPASGKSTADLTMYADMATLSGYVHAFANGHDAGVGGVQISATNGTLTRSAATVTTGSQKGSFTLPNLSLGKWVVNIAAPGYQLQSRTVNIVAGKGLPRLRASLSPSTATVTGRVQGLTGTPNLRALPGAGLTLSNTTDTYKQTSLRGGRFSFGDVAPGTYTLSAEYFGFTTSYQTVVAQAGLPGKPAIFHLGRESTTNTSVISGYVGNAASSSGSLGCEVSAIKTTEFPDGIPTLGCFVYFALIDGDGNPVPTTLGTADNANRPKGSVSPDGPTSYILSRNPADGDGLAPGQYRLTISAAGYLPATISIDVPLNGAATAPQVDLFPANSIAGRVSAIGQINGDGLPTNVAGQNCVVAVPLNLPTSVFDQTKFSCDGSAIPTGGFGPADITRLQKKCTAVGHAEPGWGVIGNNGKYTVDNLCDGQYVVYLVIANTAYDADGAATPRLSVAHGQTLEYSPTLPRRPVLNIQMTALNANTGVTSPMAPGTPVTASCITAAAATNPATTSVRQVATDTQGVVTLWGVPAGTVDCTMTANGIDADTGVISTVDNQTYPGVATVVSSLAPVFGQIVSAYGPSDHNPVAGVNVNVTGIVSYTGAVGNPLTRSVTTNSLGCYVIVAPGTTLTDAEVPTVCGTASDFTTANTREMQLRSKHVTVRVDAGIATHSLGDTATLLVDEADTIGDLPTTPPIDVQRLPVTALPVSTSGLKLTTVPAGLPLTNAVVTVSPYSTTAVGAGIVTAGINSAGELTWSDTNLTSGNLAWQGSYTLDIDVPGFTPHLSALLTCAYFDENPGDDTTIPDPTPLSLHCSLSPAQINALGELRGQITAPNLAPPHTPNAPLAGAHLIARKCATATSCPTVLPLAGTTCTPATGDLNASTNSDGRYDFVAAGGVRYMTTGTYVLIICATGMITKVIPTVPVTGGYVATEDQNLTLDLLGGVSGTVKASNNGLGLTGVTVQLFSCDTGDCADGTTLVNQLTTGSGGTYQFSGSTGRYFLTPGRYEVVFSADSLGYTGQTHDFTIDKADAPGDGFTSVTLTALGALGGRVTQAGTSPLQPVTNATLTLMRCDTTDVTTCTHLVTTTTPDGGGNYQFSGPSGKYFLSDGYYQLQIDATGFSSYDSPTPMHLVSGDNSGGDISLTQQGALNGTITDNLPSNVANANVVMTKCGDVTCTSLLTTPAPLSTVTNSSGVYAFGTPANPYVLEPGTWQLEVVAAGHVQPFKQILTIHGGTQQPTAAQQELTALDAVGGKVTVSGDPSQPVNGAILTVRAHCADPTTCTNPTLATTTSNPDGTYQFTKTGQRYFLADGDYDVTVTAAGFATTRVSPPTTVSGDNTVDVEMERLAAVQGTITDNTAGNPAVAGATVILKQCTNTPIAPAVCIPTSDTHQIRQAVTDSAGQFSFTAFGTPYLFAPGLWQVTISAPGHVASSPTDVTLTANVVNTLSAPTQLPQLVAYGSVTGTVFGTGGTTQQLSGATVTATCLSTTDLATTCPAGALTATANLSGVYTFTGTGTPWALVPGSWRFTAAATGYDSNSITRTVVSGANPDASTPAAFNISDTVRQAIQPIQVKIADSPPRYTSHVTVTLVRNDAGGTIPTTPSAGKVFTPAPLNPGVYTITVVGDSSSVGQSIRLTNATLSVPLVDAGATTLPTFVVAASLYPASLTGKVVGNDGSATPANLGNVPIELYLAGSPTRATDLGDDPIYTKTASDGTFTLSNVPIGIYDVKVNTPDTASDAPADLATPNQSYAAQPITSVSVTSGPAVAIPTVTLAATTQTVKIQVSYDSGEDLTGGTATLTPSGTSPAGWTPLMVTTPDLSPSGATPQRVFTFNNVQRGCWAFTLPFTTPTVHVGDVSTTNGTAGCRVSVPASQTAQTVPTVNYTFNEHILTISTTVTPNSPVDGAGSGNAAKFTLTVKDSSHNNVPGSPFTITGTGVTATTTTTLYLAADTYSVTLARASGVSADLWPTVSSGANSWTKSITIANASQSATIAATEAGLGSGTVATYPAVTLDTTHALTVKFVCQSSQDLPAGCGSNGTAPTYTDSGAGFSFSGLAPGSWKMIISGNPVTGPAVNANKLVTVSSGSTNSFGWP